MLPDIDGFRLCQKIREQHFFPIIMLTAKVEDMDKIMGLTLGADDYITKPFNPLEVAARVKTQLRRYMKYNHSDETEPVNPNEYDFNGLSINKDTHKCTLYGKPLTLTPIEFAILWYLCEHKGKVVSSEELFEAVWGEKFLDNNNTVMAHIGRLREKMKESSKNPKFIKTV
jgi:two-component system response regulator VanR